MSQPPASISAPLTPTQQAMLADALIHPQSGRDIEQAVITLSESVDPGALRAAWADAMTRYEALRLVFTWHDGSFAQQLCSQAGPEWTELDWSDRPPASQDAELAAWLVEDRRRGFDFASRPPHRITLIRRGAREFTLIWTCHHLLLDGRALPIVLDGVFRGKADAASPSFLAYARDLTARDRISAEHYWSAYLRDLEDLAPVTICDPPPVPPSGGESTHAEVARVLSAEQRHALVRRAEAVGVKLSTLMQAAWAFTLSRCSGSNDARFGAVLGDRRWAGERADRLVGSFIHVAPVRIDCAPDRVLRDWLAELRAHQIAVRALPPIGLPDLATWAGVQPGTRWIESLLLFESRPWDMTLRARDDSWRSRGLTLYEHTGWPLTLAAYVRDDVELRLEYERARFAPAAALALLDHVAFLLDQLASAPAEATLATFALAPPATPRPATPPVETESRTVVHLVAEVVQRQPEAPAVSAEGQTLSYREWDARADRLAHRLRAAGVTRGTPVAVLLPRGIGFCVAILAVLKAGGAYVPLDPDDPPARRADLISDCGARHGIASCRMPADGIVCWFDPADDTGRDTGICSPLQPEAEPDGTAYIIFTSGSTGRPKGVMITHRNLLHFVQAIRVRYELRQTDRVLQFCALTFDASVEEHWMTWVTGAHLIVRPPGPAPAIRDFLSFVEREAITVVDLPTAYWRAWMAAVAVDPPPVPPSLRVITVGGEEARADEVSILRRWSGPTVRWFNGYGPTECTVVATVYEPGPDGSVAAPGGGVPIGYPLPHITAHVVDAGLQPLPPGVAGELLLGGSGVAAGYVNRPDETALRFMADPFGPPGARCYRTGDRAWRRGDGALVFAGRLDQQIKWRGFRIEPGEIEAALVRHPAVREAAVLLAMSPAGTQQLAAFWSAHAGAGAASDELRSFLAAQLPAHMVPSAFVQLAALPLTRNGKANRRALPVELLAESKAGAYEPPASERERWLADLWRSALNVPRVGRHDDFFALGGHSLTALHLLHRLQSEGYAIDAAALFRAPTLSALASALDSKSATDPVSGDPVGDSWLVTLRTGPAERPPLVLLPSDYGDLLIYSNLVPLLKLDRACLGLQCPDLFRDDRGVRSMADLADRFVDLLRAAQPRGPYLLAGHCYGGYVAMEMARQLRASGERIALLALLDARPCRPAARGPDILLLYIRGALRANRADWARRISARFEQAMAARHLARQIRRAPAKVDRRSRNRLLLDQRTLVGYRSRPYDGAITYFYPDASRYQLYGDPSCGWLHLAERVEMIKVPGTHLDMMKEPNVRVLAARLQSCVQRAAES